MRIRFMANGAICRCAFCVTPLELWRETRVSMSSVQDQRDYELMREAQWAPYLIAVNSSGNFIPFRGNCWGVIPGPDYAMWNGRIL